VTEGAIAAAPPGDLADRVAALVRDVPDYPSAGVVFKDITPLLATPAVFGEVVERIALEYGPSSGAAVDAVAGIEARGFILAAPVAVTLGLPFVPIRKRGKLPHTTVAADYDLEYGTATIEVHTDAVTAGQRVLLVDDVLATGGTAAAAFGLLEQLGASVPALAVLIELSFLGGREKLPGREVDPILTV
jgi:adenine phosphoribosyltransferase